MSDSQMNKARQGMDRYIFRVSAIDFEKIPGKQIAYWVSPKLREAFIGTTLGDISISKQGLATGDNNRFLRFWHEVSAQRITDDCEDQKRSDLIKGKWVPYSKGGAFRKWYGNSSYVVEWENGGDIIRNFKDENGNERSRFRAADFYFRPAITWSLTSSSHFGARYRSKGYVFDINGMSLFPDDQSDSGRILGLLNSCVASSILKILNPTLAFQIGDISSIPAILKSASSEVAEQKDLVLLSKSDWDAYEISWDFTSLPLLLPDHHADTLETTYTHLRNHWRKMTKEMQHLEEENNNIFIDAYGLQDELTPEVPLEEITLTCNPAYRYGGKLSDEEREQRLLADTMTELLSYAVGCMFGRYSLDEPGLILANQGETLADYLSRVPEPTFMPDDDNVIPILDDTWFTDDIVERFHDFLRLTFSGEHFQDNLAFIETALGKSLRKYFVKDFYKHHVKRYKKRPIYWLFSSPKGSFKALIYMHRYRPDTVSVILNDYLREFRTKLAARMQQLEEIEASASSNARDKTAALKEITKLRNTIAELEDWERKVLLPLASEKIEIDLDDGVKANYPKFGSALAKIPGLS